MALVDAEIEGGPWPGLMPYTVADAPRFFGRDRVVRQVDRLLDTRHVAGVIGPSGSGKSSLLAAGLAAAGWDVDVVRPDRDGVRALDAASGERSPHARHVIVVDHLEEAFTVQREEAREDLLAAIVGCVAAGGHVAFALRSDHYGSCAGYPQFAELAAASHVLVGPPSEAELREIVVRPATAAGIEVPDDLVSEIVDEVLGEPGALPLVSHVLGETFRASATGTLEWDAYRRAGGVRGAIAETAERVWQDLDADQRAHARAMLVQLAEPGNSTFDVGRRIPAARLVPPGDVRRRAILDALANARIVSIDGTNVEVAHEAVFREWPRLRDWLTADRDRLRTTNNLRRSAALWDEDGRPSSALLRGSGLESAQHAVADPADPVDDVTRAFVDASRGAADDELTSALARAAEMRRVNGKLRFALVAVAVLALLVAVFGIIVWSRNADVRAQRDVADARRLAAASGVLRTDNIDLAALTAAEAYDLHHDLETTGAMLAAATAQPELRAYLHDDAAFTAVAIAGDPSVFVIDDAANAFAVWQVGDGQPERLGELAAPSGGDAMVATVEIVGKDGNVAVVTDDAGGVAAYALVTRDRLWTHAFDAAVTASDATDDRLAIATDDGAMTILDAVSGSVIGQVVAPDVVGALAFDAEGRHVSGASGLTITTWNTDDLTPEGLATELELEIWSLAYGPDDTLAVGTEADLRLLDPVTGEPLVDPVDAHDGIVHDVSYVDESLVVTSGEDGRVQFWDPATLTPLRQPIGGHAAGVLGVAVDPASGLLVTAGEDLRAGVWDLDLETPVSRRMAPRSTASDAAGALLAGDDAAVAVADNELIAIGERDGTVRFADPTGAAVAAPIVVGEDAINSIAITPDASVIAAATAAGTAQAFNPSTGVALTPPLTVGIRSTSVALDPTGTKLAVVETDAECDACTLIFDLRDPSAQPQRLAPSSRPADESSRPAYAVAFSPSGELLAFGDNAGYVDVWTVGDGDASDLAPLWSTKFERGVRSIAFSNSGTELAVGANGGFLVVLDAGTGVEQQRLNGHRGRVAGVAFSPDDSLLVSTGPDEGKARIWATGTGLPFAPAIPTGADWVTLPAWSRDGNDVFVETASGGTVAYHVDDMRLRAAMCDLARRDLTEHEWQQYVGDRHSYRTTCPGDEG